MHSQKCEPHHNFDARRRRGGAPVGRPVL